MTAREDIASNIKRFRKECGMTTAELGAACGKSAKTIAAWEVGRGQPDADATILICRALHIELSDLYGVQGETQQDEALPPASISDIVAVLETMNDDGRALIASFARSMQPFFEAER